MLLLKSDEKDHMKKIVSGIFIFLLLLLAGIFLFIPNQLPVSKIVIAKANQSSVFRLLSDKNKWPQWWPDTVHAPSSGNYLHYNGFNYQLAELLYNRLRITIAPDNTPITSYINLIPIHLDSVALEWKCELTTSFNPVQKIKQYQKAKAIKNNMADILNRLASFVADDKNIYGFSIRHTTLKDTVLVATKIVTQNYPATAIIYSLVKKLEEYIASQGAEEVNYPMLNVYRKDSVTYQTMVGIPTKRELKNSGVIFSRRLVPIKDKILTTEVRGGPATVAQGYTAIINYMNDHQLSAPVVPFEYMVTDRSKETDTTKWITRIYYPII